MKERFKCILCNSQTSIFYEMPNRTYFQCNNCLSIMMDPRDYVSIEDEKSRYESHNNDVEDPRYQKFVSPITNGVLKHFDPSHQGLDFGAGTGPVITRELEKEAYQIKLYDPYFHNYPEHLLKNYDFIICSEVMEHFHHPYFEFERFSKILNSPGSVFCMTSLYDESVNFEKWYYKNDETHVFFYHEKALEWIKKEFNFESVQVSGRLIHFKK